MDVPKLKTIWVDFNCGTNSDGLMRLTTRGSIQSIQDTGARVGETVLLTDHDVWVVALIVKQEGILYAKFDWNLIVDVKERTPPT